MSKKLPQVHFCVGLGYTDHGLDVTDSDGDGSGDHGLPPQVGVHLGHLVLVHLVELGVDPLPGVQDVLLQQVLRDLFHARQAGGGCQGLLHVGHDLVVLVISQGVGPEK